MWYWDRAWRTKHNVAFLSPEHRVMSVLAIALEMTEDGMFEDYLKDYRIGQDKAARLELSGDWWVPYGETPKGKAKSKEGAKAFDKMDLDSFNLPSEEE